MANQNINMVFGIQGHDVVARGMNQIERQVKKTVSETDKLTGSLLDQVNKLGMSEREYIKYTASLNGATKSQKDNMLAVYDAIQAKKQEAAELDKLNAQRDKEQAEYAQSQQAIQRIVSQLKEEHKLLGLTKDEIQLKKAAMAGATQAQLQEIAALQKSNREKEAAIKKSGGLTKHLRFMRGGFGQVGHQIQDVSVQMQMGTDAMLVFGQQGSQIASLFGGGGAIIGAFISIGAAISTYVSATSKEAAKNLKQMEDEFIETAKSAGVMTDSLQKFLSAELNKQITQTNAEIRQQNKVFKESKETLDEASTANKRLAGVALSTGGILGALATGTLSIFNSGVLEAARAAEQHEQKLEQLNTELNKHQEQLNDVNNGIALGKTKTDEAIQSLQEEIDVLRLQASTQMSAAKAQMIYNAMQDEEINKNPQLLAQRYAQIEALFAEKKALENLLNPQDDVNESNKEGATDAEKLAEKLKKMNEQYGLSKIELLELQAIHAAGGDSELLASLMAQIDAYRQKVKSARDETANFSEAEANMANFDAFEKSMLDRANAVDEYLMSDAEKFNKFYNDKAAALQYSIDNELGNVAQHKDNLVKLEEDKLTQISQIQSAVADATTQSLMGQFAQLASYFDQTTGIGKAFYAVQQAMAASDAIIKGYQSASAIQLAYANAAALIPDPTGASQAAMIATGKTMGKVAIGMGFATAGAIAGQTLASFEGGGITFSGVRSGGLDGKGGRLAVVHSNEKITDLEKDGSTGQPVNVQFTINAVDAKGIDQLLYERRGMITGIVQKAVNNVGRRIM